MDHLAFVPDAHWEKSIPCGNPLLHVDLTSGGRILNLGCGAGIDSYVLASTAKATLQVIGMDPVSEILTCAAKTASRQTFEKSTLKWVCGEGEHLPFGGETFDGVVMNGVLNLFADKRPVLAEIHRILKPGGWLACADLCCGSTLPEYFRDEPDSWAWCMSGACTEQELAGFLRGSTFERIHFTREEEVDLLYRVTFTCRKRLH